MILHHLEALLPVHRRSSANHICLSLQDHLHHCRTSPHVTQDPRRCEGQSQRDARYSYPQVKLPQTRFPHQSPPDQYPRSPTTPACSLGRGLPQVDLSPATSNSTICFRNGLYARMGPRRTENSLGNQRKNPSFRCRCL